MELRPTPKFDRQTGLEGFDEREKGVPRDVVLFLSEDEGKVHLSIQWRGLEEFDEGINWSVDLPITLNKLQGQIQRCRNEWRTWATHRIVNGAYPFDAQCDFSGDQAGLADETISHLAIAGRILFNQIFFPADPPQDFPAQYLDRLQAIGRIFEQLASRSLRIRVTSENVYVPWNLLYTGPIEDWVEGRGATIRGFWGYQHAIEHTPRDGSVKTLHALNPPVAVSMHLDEKIDSTFRVPCNAEVIQMFKAFGDLDLRPRNTRVDTAARLSTPPVDECVFYFCCHAAGVGEDTVMEQKEAFLKLTDLVPIKASDIDQWLTNVTFTGRPIIFLNACQTAQMNFVFYQGFAPIFLRKGASSVIGTQTEIPARFASHFAQQFFCKFLSGGGRVGDILLELRRLYADRYRNPLGLLYSVYHGADVYLKEPLARLQSVKVCDEFNI